eukprot:403374515
MSQQATSTQTALINKLKFIEGDNVQLKQYVLDLEQSLQINKTIIDSLLKDSNDKRLQTVITQMRRDNENQFSTIKKQFEEIQASNTQILLLEQVSQQYKKKEQENNQIFLDQILNLKQQLEKKSYQNEIKEKVFQDMYQQIKSILPQSDKTNHAKIERIMQAKLQFDQNHLTLQNSMNMNNAFVEKEKLQSQLDKALDDIEQLKTLLAQSTIKTLNTQMNDDCDASMEVYGAGSFVNKTFDLESSNPQHHGQEGKVGDHRLSKSFSNFVGKIKKKKGTVPELDFSQLKQIKDYKDWYSYSKKLEDAIRLLRDKINHMEDENLALNEKLINTNQRCETLLEQNRILQRNSNNLQKPVFKNNDLSFSKDPFDGDGYIDEKQIINELQYNHTNKEQYMVGNQFQHRNSNTNNKSHSRSSSISNHNQNVILKQNQNIVGSSIHLVKPQSQQSIFRKSKRNKSHATFTKKNLTLAIDLIENEAQLKQQQQDHLRQMQIMQQLQDDKIDKFITQQNNKSLNDNQEDSPIREGQYIA